MRLIDADKYLKETCTYKDTGCGSCIFQGKCIADEPTVFELPNNPTNGDIIKAMFPNGKEYDNDGDVRYEIEIDFDYSYCSYFDGVWWNAPYERR